MPVTTRKINVNAFDLTGNYDLMLLDNVLRLRPRDLASDEECLAMLGITAGQSHVDFNKAIYISRELSYAHWWNYQYCKYDDIVVGKQSAIALRALGSPATFARFGPIARQVSPSEFTVRLRMRMDDITGAGSIVNDYIDKTGVKRWNVYWNHAADKIQLITFAVNGVQRTHDINNAIVGKFANDTWYQWQITYSAANTRMRLHVKNDAGATIISGEDASAKVIPSPGIYTGSSLNFGAYFQDSAAWGIVPALGYNKSRYLDWMTYFDAEFADDFTVFSAIPTIYATGVGGDLCEGTSMVIEAPPDGKNPIWDMSSLNANPGITAAPNILGNGWTVRYRTGDTNPPTGAWSAWMTTVTFAAESDPSGQYFEFGVRCHCNNGISVFYPAVWFTLDCITDPVLELLFTDDWRIHVDDIPSLRNRLIRAICHDCCKEENPTCPPGCDRETILDADISGDDSIVPKTVS